MLTMKKRRLSKKAKQIRWSKLVNRIDRLKIGSGQRQFLLDQAYMKIFMNDHPDSYYKKNRKKRYSSE